MTLWHNLCVGACVHRRGEHLDTAKRLVDMRSTAGQLCNLRRKRTHRFLALQLQLLALRTLFLKLRSCVAELVLQRVHPANTEHCL